MNWINGFKAGNKKEKYELNLRIGTFTLFEAYYCPCDRRSCKRFRLMIFNLGLEIS